MSGTAVEVSAYYLDRANKLYSAITWTNPPPSRSDEIELISATITQRGVATSAIDCREALTINLEYMNKLALPNSRFFIVVRNMKGEVVTLPITMQRVVKEGRPRLYSSIRANCLRLALFGTGGADITNERIILLRRHTTSTFRIRQRHARRKTNGRPLAPVLTCKPPKGS